MVKIIENIVKISPKLAFYFQNTIYHLRFVFSNAMLECIYSNSFVGIHQKKNVHVKLNYVNPDQTAPNFPNHDFSVCKIQGHALSEAVLDLENEF